MITNERSRNNRTTLIEMKSATSMGQKNKHIQKLGGSITSSIDKLKRLRTKILAETNLKNLAVIMKDFEKENDQYNELQKSLAEINEKSEIYERIIRINRDFIENYDPKELKKKFDYMKNEITQHKNTENLVAMEGINEAQLSAQLLGANKYEVRQKILMQEKEELMEIQRLINQLKDIATKTSIMINAQGEKIDLAGQTMKKANMQLKDGRVLLTQANQFQQDTNKKFMAFCCLVVLIVSIIVMIVYSSHKKR